MARHTSIEVIKSLKLGEGIYQNISVSRGFITWNKI